MEKTAIERKDVAFFKKYREICKVTDDGLLFRYPASEHDFPEMPSIKKQQVNIGGFEYIGFQNTRIVEYRDCRHKTVGFFLKDGRLDRIGNIPWKYTKRMRQYKQVMSPDFSCYTDMPVLEQWINTYLNRLIGSYWQHCGLTVIPTVSWSDERSYPTSFCGLERNSVVAVTTLGTKTAVMGQQRFMAGFRELCGLVEPELVICYCSPYPEMYSYAKILSVKHEGKTAARLARLRPLPGQLSIANW